MTPTAETEVAVAVPATAAPAPPAAPAPSPESGADTGGCSPRPAAGPRSRLSVRQVRPDSLSGDDMSADVAFLIRLKGARGAAVDADELSTLAPSESSALTDADTDATLVDERGPQLEQQVAALQRELLQQRRKVARLERRNRELLEREAGAAAQGPAGEPERVRLLHTIHRLTAQTDDLQDEKRALEQRVQELSAAAQQRPPGLSAERQITDLRMRLSKAESLAEDLQEENDELRHQITEMENEMEEIQDSFCEDQVEEYQDLKKQLEQANKNGRVIQFKLRKAERSLEESQQEKESLGKQLKEFRESGGVCRDQVERLKTELKLAKEVSVKLGDEVEQLRSKDKTTGGRPPMRRQRRGPAAARSCRTRWSARPILREQMRFAEQDAAGLRRKLVRVEEENDGLTAQLRKLASKNRRRSSRDRALDGDEGIAEDMEELTPHELRIQLELNEMETATLRRKIEKIEEENETLRIQVAELQQKPSSPKLRKLDSAANINDPNAYYEHRINVLEDEMNEVRKKLIEREREIDVLKTEMQMNHKRGRGPFARARSLDLPDTASLGRMRQVQSCSPEHDTVERPPAEPAGGPEHGAAPHGGAEPEQGSGGTGGVRETALHSGVPPSAALQELEMELKSQKQSFEELARKHEILEENYAELKAQSSLERDQLDGEFTVLKHEYDAVQSELRSLREAHSSQQDQWLREKLNLEQRAKEAEKRWGVRAEETSWKLEKMRLQESLREKNEEIDKLEKSKLSQKQDIEDIRKDMERQLVTARAAGSRALEQEKLQLQQELASSQLTTDQVRRHVRHLHLR
ncbi:Protein SOGA3 [Amphibalanus amphitrite]|uniref:Protein SOGA3 n=1 Tax=Amphibalanus amphitrite TaxID=1232801 RepID=A0A6A4W1X2_AMPAM|nr:Protein SOGA3 [Amphibalanus amphitrite]